jgi:hypothetical protein
LNQIISKGLRFECLDQIIFNVLQFDGLSQIISKGLWIDGLNQIISKGLRLDGLNQIISKPLRFAVRKLLKRFEGSLNGFNIYPCSCLQMILSRLSRPVTPAVHPSALLVVRQNWRFSGVI